MALNRDVIYSARQDDINALKAKNPWVGALLLALLTREECPMPHPRGARGAVVLGAIVVITTVTVYAALSASRASWTAPGQAAAGVSSSAATSQSSEAFAPATEAARIAGEGTEVAASEVAASGAAESDQAIHADPIVANDLRELATKSQFIVVGQVTGSGEVVNLARDPGNPTRASTTLVILGQVYQVKIERYLKGNGPTTLNVVQPEGLIAEARERPVTIPTTKAAIDQAKARYPRVALKSGTRYLFFVQSLTGFDAGRNLVTGAGGNPWAFEAPANGTARPHGPFTEANDRFPARAASALLGEVEQAVRGGR